MASSAVVDDPLLDRPQDTPPEDDVNVLELSVTLAKTKTHINAAWFQLVKSWMQARCIAGACALERGGRQQLLHLQIMLRMRLNEHHLNALKDELKALVGWRRGDGSGTYCAVKQFGPGQVYSTLNHNSHLTNARARCMLWYRTGR